MTVTVHSILVCILWGYSGSAIGMITAVEAIWMLAVNCDSQATRDLSIRYKLWRGHNLTSPFIHIISLSDWCTAWTLLQNWITNYGNRFLVFVLFKLIYWTNIQISQRNAHKLCQTLITRLDRNQAPWRRHKRNRRLQKRCSWNLRSSVTLRYVV
jgi:hypothetical protein